MSIKFAVGSLISFGVCLVLYMAHFIATIIFAFNPINSEKDISYEINLWIWLISGIGGVISMITAPVLAIIGLKKSKQLNDPGKILSIVALSLASIPVFLFLVVLINSLI